MAVTVTPTVELDFVPPRVRLDVTASAGESTTTITRQDPDGRIVPVRTFDGEPFDMSTGATVLYDYEAPFGQPVWYSSLESPASATQVTVEETRAWFVHPGVPVLSMPVRVQAWGPRVRRAAQGVYWPMGRSTPVVHTDGQRKAPEYGLTVLTLDAGEASSLLALIDDSSPLLLNVPLSQGAGVTHEYVSVGDVPEARVTRLTAHAMRSWELPCTVVARPAGGSQALRTYTDLVVDFASYADLYANFQTYLDVLAGP